MIAPIPPSEAPAAGLPMGPLLFAALAGTMAMMAYVAVAGPITRQLGLPEWVAGLSVTAGGVFWMALARWWGRVSDRRGRKPVLLIGFAVCAAAYLVLAIGIGMALHGIIGAIAATGLLVASRALVGAVYAAVPPTTAALIADHTVPQQRPAQMARLGSANALGMVAGPAVAGLIAAHDLSLALGVAALLPALALLVVTLGLPAAPATRSAGPAPGQRAAQVTLFDPRLRLACLTGLIAMSSVAIAQVLIGFLAIDRLGLDNAGGARVAGLALAAVGIGLMLSQQLVIRLPDVPVARWLAIGTLVAALGFGTTALVTSTAQLLLCYGVAAFGMGFVFPSLQALTANAVGRDEQGAAAGTVSAAQGLGMVIAPLAGTLLYRLGPSVPFLLITTLLALLGLAIAARVPGLTAGNRHG